VDLGNIILIAVGVFVGLAVLSKEWERYVRREKQREDHINNESSPTS